MIKISVIVPVYNVEKYIGECLDSVLKQGIDDIQIICVDDASQDNSLSILKEYEQKDNRIVVLHNEENKGLSYTRNRGLEFAKGEYIYFLDADDKIIPDALEKLYIMAQKEELDVLLFEGDIFFEDDINKQKYMTYQYHRKQEYNEILKGTSAFVQLMSNGEWISSVPMQFWKHDYLKSVEVKFYEGILHEDQLFSFLAIYQCERVKILNEVLFLRRFRANSIMTSSVTVHNVRGYFICYCQVLEYMESIKCNEEEQQAINKFLYSLIMFIKRNYMLAKEWMQTSSYINMSAKDKHLFTLLFLEDNLYGSSINISERVVKKIKQYKSIYIYGAGQIGKLVLREFDRNQIMINGFIVTNKNEECVMGHPIFSVEDFENFDENILIVVSASKKYQADIVRILENKNCSNYILI